MAKRRKEVKPQYVDGDNKPPKIDYDTSIPDDKASSVNITSSNREEATTPKKKRKK